MRKRVRVSGRVQGVFFRDSVRREAERRDVAGWVRNCPDGTVEAVFEGDGADAMVAFCRDDPGHSQVERLEVFEEEAEDLRGFSVR
jgi:acylphosphatase